MAGELTTATFWDNKYVRKPQVKPGWFRRQVRRKFDALMQHFMELPGGGRLDILELGCAPGRMIQRLHAVGPQHRYHGIDYSPVGIAQAREFLRDARIEARMYEGDIRAVKLPQRVDLVVSFGLIEHFEDPVPMLRQHARFCRPGGYVAVTVPNFRTPMNRVLMQLFDPPAVDAHYLQIMQRGALKQALTEAGLVDVEAGGCDGPRIYPGGDRRLAAARVYRRIAAAWNLGAALSPIDVPWQFTLWAAGRVPG
jgi:SAM-dependent methyltransferase